ncbi:extracellular matrix regulator RemB [Halalkalibacter sp. AB-rgal2]|uniref:extracellular matrix regulator RemB n=1 Tax=Halalkalibacter sp. AB-rgal2 TaxID=3242695 RepID=UPI00359E0A5A
MFIHLGGDIMVRSKEIIAILNHDAKEQAITADFLKREQKSKQTTIISSDYIKSIVLTNKEIYYSPVSSLTLNRRAQGHMEIQLDKEEVDS